MEKRSIGINLLKSQQQGFFDRFINWAFTAGRAIIIFTETIALAAFLYRFTLDYQLVDLHDKIEGQQFIVTASASNEAKYRDLQERLSLAKRTINPDLSVSKLLSDIVQMATGKVRFSEVTFDTKPEAKTVTMSFSSQTIGNLSAFVQAVRLSPMIKSVAVNEIVNKPTNATIEMTIVATLK